MPSPSLQRDIKRVALLVETTRSYTRDLLAGVRSYLAAHAEWSTFLELRSLESTPPPWLEHWNGDGILTRTFSRETADAVAATGLPAVELRSTNFADDRPFVGMDNGLIGRTVAEHFLDRGYRRFGAYALESEAFFRERLRDFVSIVKDRGHACAVLSVDDDLTPSDWEQHQSRLTAWLDGLEKPAGVFAANDQLAVRLLDACRRSGIAVPEEVAVVGCENEETLCQFASPTLTSVRYDGEAVGYRAAALLDGMMRGETPPSGPILLPPRGIVVRESSDDFVIEDALVLRAVRRIREAPPGQLSVGGLCRELRLSRSTLERRMKKALGRGTKEEMLRIRFREVNRLLRDTDLTIEAIAESTGFSHPHYLHAAYKERFGRTPGQFRRQGGGAGF